MYCLKHSIKGIFGWRKFLEGETISISISINYVKRNKRLMYSILVYSIGELHFFFPFKHTFGLSFVFVLVFLRIFICLLCTCNVCLHCRHRKNGKYYTHLQQKKKGKCGDVRPSNLRPPFILGLRPKPGPIIAYEGNGISWQPKNLVENDFVLG